MKTEKETVHVEQLIIGRVGGGAFNSFLTNARVEEL